MISPMKLERPKSTPVLPEWDLGVLKTLFKPPYEPLKEAFLKHLTSPNCPITALIGTIIEL